MTVVLEARSRVGGKTWSVSHEYGNGVGVADLGGEWLNQTTQPRVYWLAEKLGLEFNDVKVQGDSTLESFNHEMIRHAYGEQAVVSASLPGRSPELLESGSREAEEVTKRLRPMC